MSPATFPPSFVAITAVPRSVSSWGTFFRVTSADAFAGDTGNVPAGDAEIGQLPVGVRLKLALDLQAALTPMVPDDDAID